MLFSALWLGLSCPYQGAGGGVAVIYPGRCHWAELICPYQGALLPAINNHPPVCQKSLAWVFHVVFLMDE